MCEGCDAEPLHQSIHMCRYALFPAIEKCREENILPHRQRAERHQLLRHNAETAAAQLRTRILGQRIEIRRPHEHLSRHGRQEPAQDMQQRTLTAARTPHHCGHRTGGKAQIRLRHSDNVSLPRTVAQEILTDALRPQLHHPSSRSSLLIGAVHTRPTVHAAASIPDSVAMRSVFTASSRIVPPSGRI